MSVTHSDCLDKRVRRFLQLARGGIQHALDGFRSGIPRFEFQCEGDRLAAEVGCCRGGTRIAPPRLADKKLAGKGEPRKSFDIAQFAGESGEKPALCLGLHPTLERSRCAREILSGLNFRPQFDKSTAANRPEEQNMKHSRDLPRCLGPDLCDVFGLKFLSPSPQIISGRRIRHPNIDPQRVFRSTPLDTPRDHVADIGWVLRRAAADATLFACYPYK